MPSVKEYRPTVTRRCKCGASAECKLCGGTGRQRQKSACWRIKWTDPLTGKVKTQKTCAKQRSVAKQMAHEKERQLLLESMGIAQPTRRSITWPQFQDEYLAYVGSRGRPGTEATYRISLTHFSGVAGKKHVHEIDTSVLQDFVHERRRQNLSAATVNKDLRAIRASLKWAESRGYIVSCPRFRDIFVREDVKAPVVLAANQRQAIFSALDDPKLLLTVRSADWWRVFLALIAELGVRRGEALALTWGVLDFDRQELTVSSETSKGRRDRTLPLGYSLVQRLAEWRNAQPTRPLLSDLVLPWERKTHRAFYEDWNRIIAAAGLPKGTKPVPKNFRSTCGSELIQTGAPTAVVKDFLGHASVTTTEAFYINTGPALRTAAENRQRLLGP